MFRRLAQAVGLTHVGGVATAKLLKRLEECHIPGDKKAILDILEVLDEKMEMECKKTGAELVENKATPLLFKLMQEMRTDGNVAYICASITARFEKIPELMLAFVELGGLHLLDEMVMIHMNNAFLSAVLPDLIASAREVGIKQAVVEIRNESANLEFCTHCQEIAQRMKDKQMGVNATTRAHSNHNNFVATVVPKGCERINKATYFMREYPTAETVQIAGLDAVIVFARSKDAKESIADTVAIEAAGNALVNFPANDKIVWRVALLFSLLAKLRQQYAMDIISENSHELLSRNFPLYRISPYVQQLILWMMNNLLLWARSRHEVHRNEACMTLISSLDYRSGQEREQKMNVMKGILPLAGQISQVYQIVVPIKIREFMRETGGKLLQVEASTGALTDQARVLAKKREKLAPKPRYGTVGSNLFTPGKEGLTDKHKVPAAFKAATMMKPVETALMGSTFSANNNNLLDG